MEPTWLVNRRAIKSTPSISDAVSLLRTMMWAYDPSLQLPATGVGRSLYAFKPDAYVNGYIEIIHELLRQEGFKVIRAKSVKVSGAAVIRMWPHLRSVAAWRQSLDYHGSCPVDVYEVEGPGASTRLTALKIAVREAICDDKDFCSRLFHVPEHDREFHEHAHILFNHPNEETYLDPGDAWEAACNVDETCRKIRESTIGSVIGANWAMGLVTPERGAEVLCILPNRGDLRPKDTSRQRTRKLSVNGIQMTVRAIDRAAFQGDVPTFYATRRSVILDDPHGEVCHILDDAISIYSRMLPEITRKAYENWSLLASHILKVPPSQLTNSCSKFLHATIQLLHVAHRKEYPETEKLVWSLSEEFPALSQAIEQPMRFIKGGMRYDGVRALKDLIEGVLKENSVEYPTWQLPHCRDKQSP